MVCAAKPCSFVPPSAATHYHLNSDAALGPYGAAAGIGAVGISGDTSDRDEACAIAGIEAAGLKADPGQDAS